MAKKSIRFYNDRQVRAVWDWKNAKWWFSAIDIVRAINDEPDYVKAGDYWRWLKRKLTVDGVQLVSVTHDFKFEAPDGKQRASDALDTACVQTLAKHYPANRANAFLDWFTYSDNTIDGQSKKKAYDLFESGLLESLEPGTSRFTPIFLAVCTILRGRFVPRISAKVDSPLPMLCTFPPFFRASKKCQKTLSTRLQTNMLR